MPEDSVDNIEPAKLKATGQLADLVLFSLSWEQEQLEDLAEQYEQAINNRDVTALLRTLNPQDDELPRDQKAWLEAIIARQPAEFTATVGSAIVAADIATSTVTFRYRWQPDDVQALVELPARWQRGEQGWRYDGPGK